MQFTIACGTEKSIVEMELSTGTQQHRILFRLGQFGFSVGLSPSMAFPHWESYRAGTEGACGLFVCGPLELTGQVPSWTTQKKHAMA